MNPQRLRCASYTLVLSIFTYGTIIMPAKEKPGKAAVATSAPPGGADGDASQPLGRVHPFAPEAAGGAAGL